MKAITCSQCGALIKRIRVRDKFAECEYCLATIPIQKEKVIVIPDQTPPKPKLRKLSEKEKKQLFKSVDDDHIPFLDDQTKNGLVIIGSIVFIFFLVIFISSYSSNEVKNYKQVKDSSTEKTSSNQIYEIKDETPTPTPFPDFSYRAFVKYNTNLGAEHVEIPTIEPGQIPKNMTEAEINYPAASCYRVHTSSLASR